MRYGIEETHAGCPVCECASDGEAQVDIPECLRRLRDSGCQFVVLYRPRRFSAIQLHSADAEHRENGDRQNNDPHATQPLEKLAIEQERLR